MLIHYLLYIKLYLVACLFNKSLPSTFNHYIYETQVEQAMSEHVLYCTYILETYHFQSDAQQKQNNQRWQQQPLIQIIPLSKTKCTVEGNRTPDLSCVKAAS